MFLDRGQKLWLTLKITEDRQELRSPPTRRILRVGSYLASFLPKIYFFKDLREISSSPVQQTYFFFENIWGLPKIWSYQGAMVLSVGWWANNCFRSDWYTSYYTWDPSRLKAWESEIITNSVISQSPVDLQSHQRHRWIALLLRNVYGWQRIF